MVYSFRDLEVFQKSRILVRRVYELTNNEHFKKDYALRDQVRRAAISIISNIAEGSGRGTRKENMNFLNIAKGSCCELQAQMIIVGDLGYLDISVSEDIILACEEINKMISGLLGYMHRK